MSAEDAKQPVVGLCWNCGLEYDATVKRKHPAEAYLGAAAADFADAPATRKTAFDSSAQVGELEAERESRAAQWRKYSQERMDEPEAMALYMDMKALERVVEIMRSRSPTKKVSDSPPLASTDTKNANGEFAAPLG